MLKGKDLINLGFEPNKYFTKILNEINEFGLVSREDISKVFDEIAPYGCNYGR